MRLFIQIFIVTLALISLQSTSFAESKNNVSDYLLGASDYVIVPDKDVIKFLNTPPEGQLRSEINLLVWNTHKGEDGNKWAQDLKELSRDRHLVLLQEGMDDDFMPGALKALEQFGWIMGQSFYMNRDHNGTGVITGSVQRPFAALFQRTKDFEPVVKTPKITLFSSYLLENGSKLLVVNIHGINFKSLQPFQRQIDEMMALIKSWNGKVILAGDFNTWAEARTTYLEKAAREAGLTQVLFAEDPRKLKLDHIYLRGCSPLRSTVHSDIDSSDHKPLTADLVCPQ